MSMAKDRDFAMCVRPIEHCLEENSVPSWIFDQDTLEILEVNTAAEFQYGYSRNQFLRLTIIDLRPIQDIPRLLRKTLRASLRGPSTRERWRHRTSDGTIFEVEITSREITFRGRAAELVTAMRPNTA
jgi:PAS domain S-box-containing protein